MSSVPERRSTSDRQFAEEVVQRLRQAGFVAYWAGGCVRDLLLGKSPKDYDVATDAPPDAVQELFGYKRTKAVGAAFGVILIHGPPGLTDIEVATFRAEGPYLDGRRPEHVVFCTPEQDALRRDFTINGMFYDPFSEQVLDYVGGQADLQARVIRAIGHPEDRFREDKLRILRAIRFASTMDFLLELHTATAIREMAADVRIVSVERITQEWKRMLTHSSRCRALELAHATRVLPHVFLEAQALLQPDAEVLWWRSLQAVTSLEHQSVATGLRKEPRFELVLATWLCEAPGYSPQSAETMCKRLRFSNDELERIVWLRAQSQAVHGIRSASLSQLKRLLAHPFAEDLLAQTRAVQTAAGRDLADVEFGEIYLRETSREVLDPPALITGDDLIRSGLRPGKAFKMLLDALRDAQLECRISTPTEAQTLAQELSTQMNVERFKRNKQ
ncbi:MAG: cca [Planctomycetaceae bacterium]|nr:cca [Planctomycetaceae bacterium]